MRVRLINFYWEGPVSELRAVLANEVRPASGDMRVGQSGGRRAALGRGAVGAASGVKPAAAAHIPKNGGPR
jgi:hypothetical protein